MTVHVYTIAIDVEESPPSSQEVANAIAAIPPLEGEVNVMSDMTISPRKKDSPEVAE